MRMKIVKPYVVQHLNCDYVSSFVAQYVGIGCAMGSVAADDAPTRIAAGISGALLYASGKLLQKLLDKQQNEIIVNQVVNSVLDERERDKESQLAQKTADAPKSVSEATRRDQSDAY